MNIAKLQRVHQDAQNRMATTLGKIGKLSAVAALVATAVIAGVAPEDAQAHDGSHIVDIRSLDSDMSGPSPAGYRDRLVRIQSVAPIQEAVPMPRECSREHLRDRDYRSQTPNILGAAASAFLADKLGGGKVAQGAAAMLGWSGTRDIRQRRLEAREANCARYNGMATQPATVGWRVTANVPMSDGRTRLRDIVLDQPPTDDYLVIRIPNSGRGKAQVFFPSDVGIDPQQFMRTAHDQRAERDYGRRDAPSTSYR